MKTNSPRYGYGKEKNVSLFKMNVEISMFRSLKITNSSKLFDILIIIIISACHDFRQEILGPIY